MFVRCRFDHLRGVPWHNGRIKRVCFLVPPLDTFGHPPQGQPLMFNALDKVWAGVGRCERSYAAPYNDAHHRFAISIL